MSTFTYLFDNAEFKFAEKTQLVNAIEKYNDTRSLAANHQAINYDLYSVDKVLAFVAYIENHPSQFDPLKTKVIKLTHPTLLLSNSVGLSPSDIEKGFMLSPSHFSDYENPIPYNSFNETLLSKQADQANTAFHTLDALIKEQQQKLPTLKENVPLYRETLEAINKHKYIRFLCAKTKYWNLKYLSVHKKDDLPLKHKADESLEMMYNYIAPPRYSVLVEKE